MSRRAQVARAAQQRLTERLAERDARRAARQQIEDATIVHERNRRGRPTVVERPLPYGALPPSAADTPGFEVGQPVDPSTFPSGNQAPAQNIEPIVDRDAARNEVYTQMMQQYGGSNKEEAYANAPRSNEVGYSDRADIQAWMKANPALAENFMAKQREKGLVDETSTEFGGVRLTQPKGNSLEDIDTRKQGAAVNPLTGQTNIQDAQDSVNRVRAQEMVDVMRGESQIEGLEFGNVPGQPRLINQASMISKGEQAIGEQAKKTEAAIPLWDKSMQPYSAGSDIGIEPSQVWNMANIGELPVFGGGKLLFGRYAGK